MKIKIKNIIGHTLLEIIVTIIILGTLASMAIPRLTASMENARSAEGVKILSVLREAQMAYSYENSGAFATNLNDLLVEIPSSTLFAAPTLGASNPIASIIRGTGANYSLTIDADGCVKCPSGTDCGKLSLPAC